MGRATRITVPEDVSEVEAALRAAEMRLAALRTLGIQAPDLEAAAAAGRSALADGDLTGAQSRADEVRIVVKLAATEMERMLNRGEPIREDTIRSREAPTTPEERPAAARSEAPGADLPDEVAAVVEDAFGKALYSKALRQMVEIVAAERLREFLQDREMMEELIGDLVAKRMREAERDILPADA